MLCRWRRFTARTLSIALQGSLVTTSEVTPPESRPVELKPSDKKILKRVLSKIENTRGKPSRCTPEDVWRVLFACSKMDGSESVLQRTMRRVDAQMMRRATAKDLGLFMDCLGRLHRQERIVPPADWEAAVTSVLYEIRLHHPVRRFVIGDVVRMIAAMAAMDIQDEALVRSCIERYIWDNKESLSGYDCSTLLWALTKLEIQNSDWLHELSKVLLRRWSSLKAQEATTAIQTWTHQGENFKAYVQAALASMVKASPKSDLKSKHYIVLLNCLSRLHLQDEKQTIEFLTEQLLDRLGEDKLKPASLAMATWTLGQLRYRHTHHVNRLATEIVRPSVLSRLSMQGLCRVSMGWAYMDVIKEQHVHVLAEEVLSPSRLASIQIDQLAMLNGAFGKLGIRHSSLINRLIDITTKTEHVRAYSNEQLCIILEGWMLLRVKDIDAASALAREASIATRLRGYTASQVSHLLWCIGSLRVPNMTLYKCLREQLGMESHIVDVTAEDVKRALHGCLSGGYHDVSVAYMFGDIYQHWLTSGKLNEANADDLTAIRSILKKLPYIEPMHIHQIGRELERRKTEDLLHPSVDGFLDSQ